MPLPRYNAVGNFASLKTEEVRRRCAQLIRLIRNATESDNEMRRDLHPASSHWSKFIERVAASVLASPTTKVNYHMHFAEG